MALGRGELVGEAFIRVTTDLTAGRRNLHRDARAMGAEFSSEFGKEVEASIEARMAGARKKIANSLANIDFSEFEKRFGSVGAAVNKMEEAFEDLRKEGTITNKEFELFTKTLHTWAADASVRERATKDAEALRKLSAEVSKAHTEANRLNKVFDAQDFDFALRDAAVAAERFNRSLRDSNSIQFGDKFSEAQVSLEKLRQGLRGSDALILKAARSSDDLDGGLRRSSRSGGGLLSVFGSISKTLDGISHRGNPLVDLLVAPLRAGAALGKMFESLFGKSFAKLAAGSRVLGVFGGLAGSIGAAVIAMGAAAKVASLFASALSLVAGMATIAASAIGGALVGALFLVAGAVPAALAGLGGLILFMADFEKKAPRATAAAKKFGDSFRAAFDAKAFVGMDRAITTTLTKLQPLAKLFAEGLGDAMNKSIGNFIALLNDPAMQKSLQALLVIPGQMNRLANAAINTFGGLLGVFRALAPFVTVFLDRLTVAAARFNVWANSSVGQERLTKFFSDVTRLADKAWAILVNVGKAIAGIFNAAVDGGTADKFLDFLVHITDKFAEFVRSTEGQNKLKAWFDQAYRAGQALGELIRGVAAIFGALDTSKSRDQVIKLTDGIGNFLTRSAPKLESFLGFIDGIGDSLGKLNFQPFIDFVSFFTSALGEFFEATKGDAFDALNAKLDGFNTLGDTIKNDLLPAMGEFKKIMMPIWEFLGSAAFQNAADGFRAVSDVINGAVTALSGFLNLLSGVITLDGEKIKKGFEQIFEGAGKAAVGAFNVALTSGGVKGIFDKLLGTDSLNFDETKKNIDGFFAGINESTSNFDNTIGDTISGFFSDLGQKFTDARLAVGQFFTDLFSGVSVGGVFESIETSLDTATQNVMTWATNLGATIGGFFANVGTTIGSFFTTTLPTAFEGARLAIGQFFTDLPFTIAAALGAASGIIVNFFYEQAIAIITQWQTVVIPFFQNLPATIASYFSTAVSFLGNWFSNQWNAVFAYFETVAVPWITAIPGRIEAALDSATASVVSWFTEQWNKVFAYFETVAIPWITAIPGKIEAALDTATDAIVNWFKDSWDRVTSWWSGTALPWIRNIPTMAKNAITGGVDWLRSWFAQSWASVQSWWFGTAVPWLRSLPSTIVSAFGAIASNVGGAIAAHMKGVVNGIIAQINQFIASFNSFSPFDLNYMRYLAKGGLVSEPTIAMMGEGGKRELVVPLDRPLSQIDESVRGLAAIAQGKAPSTVNTAPGKALVIQEGAIQVTSLFSDPELVAQSVLDRIPEEVFG